MKRERGSVTVMMLLVLLLALCALAVSMGTSVAATKRSRVQSVADLAALAAVHSGSGSARQIVQRSGMKLTRVKVKDDHATVAIADGAITATAEAELVMDSVDTAGPPTE